MAKKKSKHKAKRPIPVSRQGKNIVIEYGDFKISLPEDTIAKYIGDTYSAVRDGVKAVKNIIRPMQDDELEDFLKRVTKKKEEKD